MKSQSPRCSPGGGMVTNDCSALHIKLKKTHVNAEQFCLFNRQNCSALNMCFSCPSLHAETQFLKG